MNRLLGSRRELGLIVHDAKTVKALIGTFEADWTSTKPKNEAAPSKDPEKPTEKAPPVSEKDAEKAVRQVIDGKGAKGAKGATADVIRAALALLQRH